MAKAMYVGVNNVARKVKKVYVGVNGVARKVKKIYVGVNGVARLCWSGEALLTYYGDITIDTVDSGRTNAASNQNYAIFSYYASFINAISSTLTKIVQSYPSNDMSAYFSEPFEEYACFMSTSMWRKGVAYNNSLTRTLYQGPDNDTGTCTHNSNYLLVGGGGSSGVDITTYNKSFTKGLAGSPLSTPCTSKGGTIFGQYAIFAGGAYSWSSGDNDYYAPRHDVAAYDGSLTKTALTDLHYTNPNYDGKVAGDTYGASTNAHAIFLTTSFLDYSTGTTFANAYDSSLTRVIPMSTSVTNRWKLKSMSTPDLAIFSNLGQGPYNIINTYDQSLVRAINTTLQTSSEVINPISCNISNYALFSNYNSSVAKTFTLS